MRALRASAALLLSVLCAVARASPFKPDGRADSGGGGGGGALVAAAGGGQLPTMPFSPIIAGKPCAYTPAVLPTYTDFAAYNSTDPLLACNDTRLSAAQAVACMTCLSIRDERACLRQTAVTSYGADTESCTWVGFPTRHDPLPTKKVRYSLGINSPRRQSFTFSPGVCAVDINYDIVNPLSTQVYPTFQVTNWLNGLTPNGTEIPGGLQSGFVCAMRRGKPRCSGRVIVHRQASFMYMARTVWTDSLAITEALQRSNATCDDAANGICSSYGPPYNFDYTMTLKEHRCPKGALAPTTGTWAFAEPGNTLAAGGRSYSVVREMWMFIEGASRVSWRVKSEVPMFVAAANRTAFDAECVRTPDRSAFNCDTAWIASMTWPGSMCIGTDCAAAFPFDPSLRGWYMVIAYAKPWTEYPNGRWIIDPAVTPKQTVEIREFNVWP